MAKSQTPTHTQTQSERDRHTYTRHTPTADLHPYLVEVIIYSCGWKCTTKEFEFTQNLHEFERIRATWENFSKLFFKFLKLGGYIKILNSWQKIEISEIDPLPYYYGRVGPQKLNLRWKFRLLSRWLKQKDMGKILNIFNQIIVIIVAFH